MDIIPELFSCCRIRERRVSLEKDINGGLIDTKENKPSENPSISIKMNQEKEPNNKPIMNHTHLTNQNKDNHHRSSHVSINSQVTFSNMKVESNAQSNSFIDTEIMNRHELVLSGELFWNKDITIDPLGLKMGKRKKRDGITVFGTGAVGKNEGHYKNDFVINVKNEYNKESSSYFMISYEKGEDKFYISKINEQVQLAHLIDYDYFLDVNCAHSFIIGKIKVDLLITPSPDNQSLNQYEFKVYEKNDKVIRYIFTNKELPITIGRSNSRINIKNSSISKIHAAIDFSQDYKKYYIKDMGSTNGTYYDILYKGQLKLTGEMKFKIFDTKFVINESE